ncbi:hypothetical protein [Lentzea sp. NPDC055074]
MMRVAFRWFALGLALLATTSGLAGCTSAFTAPECGSAADAVVTRLKVSPVLESLPPETKGSPVYATKPCDDEDGSGRVGRQLTSTSKDDALLAYFREEFPKLGWVLRHEKAALPRVPEGLDVGEPHQCFENPEEPNVNLEVMLGLGENPDTDLHVTFVFKDGKALSCASVVEPTR